MGSGVCGDLNDERCVVVFWMWWCDADSRERILSSELSEKGVRLDKSSADWEGRRDGELPLMNWCCGG